MPKCVHEPQERRAEALSGDWTNPTGTLGGSVGTEALTGGVIGWGCRLRDRRGLGPARVQSGKQPNQATTAADDPSAADVPGATNPHERQGSSDGHSPEACLRPCVTVRRLPRSHRPPLATRNLEGEGQA